MPIKILVADNDARVGRAMKMAFRYKEYEIMVRADGVSALATYKAAFYSSPFGVVLTDLHLPEMNGSELLAAISSDDFFKPVTILMSTEALANVEDRKGRPIACDAFFNKPLPYGDFDQEITRLLSLRRRPMSRDRVSEAQRIAPHGVAANSWTANCQT